MANRSCKKCGWMLIGGKCSACEGCRLMERQERERRNAERRQERQGQTTYNRGSRSGGYGRSSYSMRSGTFDGMPSLSRQRDDGATEIFYQEGGVDMDDAAHGHAVIKNGKLVYKRPPGASSPVVDRE